MENEFPVLFSYAKEGDPCQNFLMTTDLQQNFHLPLSSQANQEWGLLADRLQNLQII